jgi:putative tryptophan/tyrosine transport system substrate-binding protein
VEGTVRQRADGLVVALDTLTQANRQLFVELAGKHRLPVVYASSEFFGGLATYGVNYADVYRRAAAFVDKIFKGAKPADIPMQQPTQFELVVNLKTAKALRLAIPPLAVAASGPGHRVAVLDQRGQRPISRRLLVS